MQYDITFFDLDGTLVDSLPDILGAVNHVLGDHGLAPLDLDAVRPLVGDGVLALATRALALQPESNGIDPAVVAAAIKEYYAVNPCVHSVLYPGIDDVLRYLKKGGASRIVVLTNKPGNVARLLLQKLGVSHLFDAVIGDGDGFARKPSPEPARAILAQFGLETGRMLVVGDGVPDMAMGKTLGCDVVAALWGYTPRERLAALQPKFLLETPQDLLKMVRS